jgi:hypothetical protein
VPLWARVRHCQRQQLSSPLDPVSISQQQNVVFASFAEHCQCVLGLISLEFCNGVHRQQVNPFLVAIQLLKICYMHNLGSSRLLQLPRASSGDGARADPNLVGSAQHTATLSFPMSLTDRLHLYLLIKVPGMIVDDR